MTTDRQGVPIRAPARCPGCRGGWYRITPVVRAGRRRVYCRPCGRFICEVGSPGSGCQTARVSDTMTQGELFPP